MLFYGKNGKLFLYSLVYRVKNVFYKTFLKVFFVIIKFV